MCLNSLLLGFNNWHVIRTTQESDFIKENAVESEIFQFTYPLSSICSVGMFENIPKEIYQIIPPFNKILSHIMQFFFN